jgi:hypothetical protein
VELCVKEFVCRCRDRRDADDVLCGRPLVREQEGSSGLAPVWVDGEIFIDKFEMGRL